VQLHRIRARNLASGGVYATIGAIQKRLDAGGVPDAEYAISLATYRPEQGGPGAYPQTVTVRVADEAARINLNTAPGGLLEAAGLEADGVNKLMDLRAKDQALVSVDALRTEEVLDATSFDALAKDRFTVYTGRSGAVNLNTAGIDVLSAVFAISSEEASALAEKRPFENWPDVLQKVGREPATFNVDVAPFAPRQRPASLSLSSRTFRIRSTVSMDMPGGNHRPEHAGVEAVVAFGADGGYTIRSWKELRGADARNTNVAAEETETAQAVPEEPGN
jgi:hypothetical protein